MVELDVDEMAKNQNGYGLSERTCLPCSGVSGTAAISSYSCCGHYKLFPAFRILLRSKQRASFVCLADSNKRNPDFSRRNKQGHGFSRGNKNRQNPENDSSEIPEEPELLASKNGPLLSLSGGARRQATSSPGQREKEIVELFRKVQAQLRERAAIKEEKKIEAAQGGQGEKGTVDSLLKLLRKHSVSQGKQRISGGSSEGFNLDQPERGSPSLYDDEQNSNFLDSNNVASSMESQDPVGPMRPLSNFRRKSPVPRMKFEPIISEGDEDVLGTPLKPVEKKKKSTKAVPVITNVQKELELPIIPDVHEEAFDDGEDRSEPYDDEEEANVEAEEAETVEPTDLSSLKLSELRAIAKSRGMKGYSKLKKGELVELLSEDGR
ncbi:hypothetical protein QJS04_geneDACA002394 [Acorus gramineus]|uniref:Rho termination factor-like N-terminal domain-containing protein n=1 Tax=Acorus gramineus TaxID=55184 RepID=A0AAV9A9A0_ACOGR|nr:hypothetical protein QJS04_geneDACA002394 [Acorus gramineus]